MLHRLVNQRRDAWLAAPDCPARSILTYIREKDKLRPPQIEAIETYLFLKLAGANKPLRELFAEGFFAEDFDLDRLPLATATRDYLRDHTPARALYSFARQSNGKQALMPEVARRIEQAPDTVDYASIIESLFYGVHYADYLFSLPMGAGKTFQMAAFIYLDLYLALNEPDDKRFAHNFLVLIPSGLKSSIGPSLRTIEHFDPTWVLAEPAASQLKAMLRFEVLDQPKTGARSNKTRNPNADKVNRVLRETSPMGHIFVVNAEKVILNRADVSEDQVKLFKESEKEEYARANELRNRLGKLPNLALHIDEVHHAAQDDVLLRRVVNHWQEGGTITTVLGYTGTPYLKRPDVLIVAPDLTVKLSQITNTVYYYPLAEAVRTFLKKPTIQKGRNMEPAEIIRQGVREFRERYGATVYPDHTTAKLAIYCSSIERLETEVRPLLLEAGVPASEILAFHRGNKQYPITKEAERAFNLLDTPHSTYRYILLVGIGKEGWSCRSLTSVVLSAAGDSPRNMVLQTACRCLREVTRNAQPPETALIWLNEANAKLLDDQLREEQQTSIEELNRLGQGGSAVETIRQVSRAERLRLPPVEFVQFRVNYETTEDTADADAPARLAELSAPAGLETHRAEPAMVETFTIARSTTGGSDLQRLENYILHDLPAPTVDALTFGGWLRLISREGLGRPTVPELRAHAAVLRPLFEQITVGPAAPDAIRRPRLRFDHGGIRAAVRRAFQPVRTLHEREEVVPRNAQLLVVAALKEVALSPLLYPAPEVVSQILQHDEAGTTGAEVDEKQAAADRAFLEFLEQNPAMASMPMYQPMAADARARLAQPGAAVAPEIRQKDRSFHYLPYDFSQSEFERNFLREALALPELAARNLEIYFNGARHLTEFRIDCYKKVGPRWRSVGRYTPDFLVIERREEQIHRLLLVETKGSGYLHQEEFQDRWQFTTTKFLEINNPKAGYPRFAALLLPDDLSLATRLQRFQQRLTDFFTT